MQILLATGDSDLRLALELLLNEEPGVYISGTTSSSEGLLALVGSTHPDLVILDEDLPGDIFEKTLAKALSVCSTIKYIVLGSNSSTKNSILKAGADVYAAKGEPPEILLGKFRQLDI